MRAVKLCIDGAPGSRGAALKADYSDDAGNRGLLGTAPDEFRRIVAKAKDCGVQVATHAIGDRGNGCCWTPMRRCSAMPCAAITAGIEHAQVVDVADVARFAEFIVRAGCRRSA